MKRERRSFSPEDRLSILQEASKEGQTQTCRKYLIAPSLFARWKKKYLSQGYAGLKPAYKRVDPAIRDLEEENWVFRRYGTTVPEHRVPVTVFTLLWQICINFF